MRLHIGSGKHKIDGFLNIDIQPHGGKTDAMMDVAKLGIKSESVEEIYASHILEHFRHTQTIDVLKEWHRTLKNGGILYVAVPDFDIVIDVYIKAGYLCDWVRDVLYGNQNDRYSAEHYTSFTFSTLCRDLHKSGFKKMESLESMPYGLKDNSQYIVAADFLPSVHGKKISLIIKAIKGE